MNPSKTKIMPVHKKKRQEIENMDKITVEGHDIE